MAKALGIIGNIKGKVGNVVGYNLTDSNNKQTQGLRVYQPNVKNPKTAAQAEQRAKLAPINATYRALKMIIDRGNEGLPYGNKSRLAWLKSAFMATEMPWIEKGTYVGYVVGCPITKGSLTSLMYEMAETSVEITVSGLAAETPVSTIGALSTALLSHISTLKNGDQITILTSISADDLTNFEIKSFVLDTTSTESISGFSAESGNLSYETGHSIGACSVIVSREGANGEHLRSSEMLLLSGGIITNAPYDSASKTAAIKSYMNSTAMNTDWAEESIQ